MALNFCDKFIADCKNAVASYRIAKQGEIFKVAQKSVNL